MNTDIRIDIGLSTHPKTIKLMRRCGDRAFYCLVRLWSWAAQHRPDGNLEGMDNESVEIAADWNGEEGMFASQLAHVGFLDGNEHGYALHDWCHHNPWACKAEERSDNGRLNKLAGRFPEQVAGLKKEGITGISKEDYMQYIKVWSLADRSSKPQGNPKCTPSEPSTPTPTPSPSPTPTPTPTSREYIVEEGGFQMTSDWKPSEYFPTLAATAGIVPLKGVELETALQEFIPYWLTKNRNRTAHEWDLAFIKAIKNGFTKVRHGQKETAGMRMTPRQQYMHDLGNHLEAIDDGTTIGGSATGSIEIGKPLSRGGIQRENPNLLGC